MRRIFLKARQFGITTVAEAVFFCNTLNVPNTETVVIAHDADSTEKIFRIIKRFYDNLREDVKPAAKYASRREFYWPEIGSSFYVGTAGSREFGRGTTVNNVHGSEVAFWPDATSIVAGLLQAVPEGGAVCLESTGNGLGDYFSTEWERTEEGESVFKPFFIGWNEHEEYREDPGPDFVRTDEEEALAEAYELEDDQLAWRRRKKKELREKLPQEYPITPREAFLSSGNPYFDRTALEEIRRECRSPRSVTLPPHMANLRSVAEGLEVFKLPDPNRRYVLSADPSEGLTGTASKPGDHDYCSADVFDAGSWVQVATLHGRFDPHSFGLLLATLGRWYNLALVGVERNNHGHAVLNALIHADGYPLATSTSWGGVYCHEEFDEDKRDKEKRPGWPTTVKTKFFALDTLAEMVLSGDMTLNSKRTVEEMLRFVKMAGGKAGGEAGSHDDRVISASIGAALLKTVRPPVEIGVVSL